MSVLNVTDDLIKSICKENKISLTSQRIQYMRYILNCFPQPFRFQDLFDQGFTYRSVHYFLESLLRAGLIRRFFLISDLYFEFVRPFPYNVHRLTSSYNNESVEFVNPKIDEVAFNKAAELGYELQQCYVQAEVIPVASTKVIKHTLEESDLFYYFRVTLEIPPDAMMYFRHLFSTRYNLPHVHYVRTKKFLRELSKENWYIYSASIHKCIVTKSAIDMIINGQDDSLINGDEFLGRLFNTLSCMAT